MATLFVRAFDLPSAPEFGFEDIAGNEHAANIDALATAGITKGCNPPANTRFCPDRVTTRAEMASFLVRALDLGAAPDQPFVDVSGNVHADDIASLAFAGITKGCNPPTNDLFCPDDSVTRAQTGSFLTRSLSDVAPIFNQLSLESGFVCTKDGLICLRNFAAASGIQWEVTGGIYNVVPFLPGEEAIFEAGTTRLEIEVNGVPVALSELAQTQSGSLAMRRFTAVLPATGSGTTTIVARWLWNGTVVRTLTIRSTS